MLLLACVNYCLYWVLTILCARNIKFNSLIHSPPTPPAGEGVSTKAEKIRVLASSLFKIEKYLRGRGLCVTSGVHVHSAGVELWLKHIYVCSVENDSNMYEKTSFLLVSRSNNICMYGIAIYIGILVIYWRQYRNLRFFCLGEEGRRNGWLKGPDFRTLRLMNATADYMDPSLLYISEFPCLLTLCDMWCVWCVVSCLLGSLLWTFEFENLDILGGLDISIDYQPLCICHCMLMSWPGSEVLGWASLTVIPCVMLEVHARVLNYTISIQRLFGFLGQWLVFSLVAFRLIIY